MKTDRRRDLLRILHDGTATSQKEIVRALKSAGHSVTQATVSRDLTDMGATKVRINGAFVYRLPDEVPHSVGGDLMARNLARTLEEFALEIQTAGSIVVVNTAPGHAAAVARAIDLAGVGEIVGTVAGDDTIFAATPSEDTAERVAAAWMIGDRTEEGA
jgi:transcriptional regulator of arginine metabolism